MAIREKMKKDSMLFSHWVVPNSLRPHGLQHTRPSYPSLSPRVCPSSCPLNQWCSPTISSSVTLLLLPSKRLLRGMIMKTVEKCWFSCIFSFGVTFLLCEVFFFFIVSYSVTIIFWWLIFLCLYVSKNSICLHVWKLFCWVWNPTLTVFFFFAFVLFSF